MIYNIFQFLGDWIKVWRDMDNKKRFKERI